jgi:hypothetical protein
MGKLLDMKADLQLFQCGRTLRAPEISFVLNSLHPLFCLPLRVVLCLHSPSFFPRSNETCSSKIASSRLGSPSVLPLKLVIV